MPADFIRAHTRLAPVPFVPEVRLHQADEPIGLWEATERDGGAEQPPPFWAFAWAGGQALARYVLDRPESVAGFLSEQWTVASEADRIGYRLKGGTPLDFVPRTPPFGAGDDPSNIVDACYPVGSIQVPSGQEPIVLHRDAVSGGGYMMIGTVISADMDRIGQLPPNAKVRFVEVSLDEALVARAEREQWLDEIRSATSS